MIRVGDLGPAIVKQLSRQIKKIEKKQNKGPLGEWRKDFCKKYSKLLIQIRNNTYNSLAEKLAAKDGRITCQKGCTHCCHHYVTVSAAHGIVIVDYLYRKRKLLTTFLANYKKWHGRGYELSDRIDRERISALSASRPTDGILRDTRPMSQHYLGMNIPCPFLMDDECLIYDVRPLSCSGHFSASPPDWCAPGSQQKPEIHHLIPNDSDLIEIVRLADPRLVMYELTLPKMIHQLLTEGGAAVMNEVVQHDFQ